MCYKMYDLRGEEIEKKMESVTVMCNSFDVISLEMSS